MRQTSQPFQPLDARRVPAHQQAGRLSKTYTDRSKAGQGVISQGVIKGTKPHRSTSDFSSKSRLHKFPGSRSRHPFSRDRRLEVAMTRRLGAFLPARCGKSRYAETTILFGVANVLYSVVGLTLPGLSVNVVLG